MAASGTGTPVARTARHRRPGRNSGRRNFAAMSSATAASANNWNGYTGERSSYGSARRKTLRVPTRFSAPLLTVAAVHRHERLAGSMRPPALGAFERKRLRLRSGEKPRAPRSAPAHRRYALPRSSPRRYRRSGQGRATRRNRRNGPRARPSGQARRCRGRCRRLRNKLHCEYLDAGGVVERRIADDAAAVAPRRVLVRAKLMFGDEAGFFHIAEHDVGKRGIAASGVSAPSSASRSSVSARRRAANSEEAAVRALDYPRTASPIRCRAGFRSNSAKPSVFLLRREGTHIPRPTPSRYKRRRLSSRSARG